MTFPATYSDAAAVDVREVVAWYEAQSPGLGVGFLRALDEATDGIALFPGAGRAVGKRARRTNLRGFPYTILYRPESKRIMILAVIHLHRHPQSWRSRL